MSTHNSPTNSSGSLSNPAYSSRSNSPEEGSYSSTPVENGHNDSASPHQTKSCPPLVELFIGDLSYFCTEEQIAALFSTYGTVAETRIRRSDRGGHSLMYGFVKMTSLQDAETAANALNDQLYMGRRLR